MLRCDLLLQQPRVFPIPVPAGPNWIANAPRDQLVHWPGDPRPPRSIVNHPLNTPRRVNRARGPLDFEDIITLPHRRLIIWALERHIRQSPGDGDMPLPPPGASSSKSPCSTSLRDSHRRGLALLHDSEDEQLDW